MKGHRKLIVGVVATALLAATLIVAAGWATGRTGPEAASHPDDLARRCRDSAAGGPEGRVVLNGSTVIADARLELEVACRMVLLPGASFTLRRAQVVAPGLFIGDEAANGHATVVVEDSTLTGLPGAAFQIVLYDDGDELTISGSRVEFPVGVVAVVGSDDLDGGGRITIEDSVIRSPGPGSKGIVVVAGEGTGRIELRDVTFAPGGGAEFALVLAGECLTERVAGGPPRCQP